MPRNIKFFARKFYTQFTTRKEIVRNNIFFFYRSYLCLDIGNVEMKSAMKDSTEPSKILHLIK